MSKRSDSADAAKAKKQVEDNIKKDADGKLNPIFMGLSNPIKDPYSPIGVDIDDLAIITAQNVPNPASSTSAPTKDKQNKKEIEEMMNKVAHGVGYLANVSHLEDLYLISGIRRLSEEDVWLYIRGAMRSSQISVMNNLEKVVKSLEGVVSKSQNSMSNLSDSNKQLTEKLSLISQKVDNISPNLSALITNEFKANKVVMNSIKASVSTTQPPPLTNQPAIRDRYPGTPELTQIFQHAGIPPKVIEKFVAKYIGKVTWEEYAMIITGKMLASDAQLLIKSWANTKSDK